LSEAPKSLSLGKETGSTLSDVQLNDLLSRFDHPSNVALLLHGSYAAGRADENSDVDVIRILKRGPQTTRHQNIAGIDVDLSSISLKSLHDAIYAQTRDNNNFYLHCLAGGRLYFDREGEGESLQREALLVQQRGPEAVSRSEMALRRDALMTMLRSTRRRARLSRRSATNGGIAELYCSELFRRALYSYRVIDRKWTCGLAEMLTWIIEEESDVSAITVEYASANSLDLRLNAAEELTNLVCRKVASGLVGEPTNPEAESSSA
jgi:predicted nucleotidyltransferase